MDENLVMLDDPGRVRSQITRVVCQIQWFDFDCNLVVMRKVIIRIPVGLDLDHLHYSCTRGFKPKPASRNDYSVIVAPNQC